MKELLDVYGESVMAVCMMSGVLSLFGGILFGPIRGFLIGYSQMFF